MRSSGEKKTTEEVKKCETRKTRLSRPLSSTEQIWRREKWPVVTYLQEMQGNETRETMKGRKNE